MSRVPWLRMHPQTLVCAVGGACRIGGGYGEAVRADLRQHWPALRAAEQRHVLWEITVWLRESGARGFTNAEVEAWRDLHTHFTEQEDQ